MTERRIDIYAAQEQGSTLCCEEDRVTITNKQINKKENYIYEYWKLEN